MYVFPFYQARSLYQAPSLLTKFAELTLQVVIKSTRRQLERELLLEDIQRIQDMPSYMLLTC